LLMVSMYIPPTICVKKRGSCLERILFWRDYTWTSYTLSTVWNRSILDLFL